MMYCGVGNWWEKELRLMYCGVGNWWEKELRLMYCGRGGQLVGEGVKIDVLRPGWATGGRRS